MLGLLATSPPIYSLTQTSPPLPVFRKYHMRFDYKIVLENNYHHRHIQTQWR